MVRILLVRHGESEGNANHQAYVDKGDCNVGLTDKGWLQAQHLGKFLNKFYKDTKTKKWPLVYVSGYERPQETLSGALEHIDTFKGDPLIYTDSRLVEQSFGGINHLQLEHPDSAVEKEFARLMLQFSAQVYKNDKITAKPPFGESILDKMVHVKGFIDGSLNRDIHNDGHDDIVIFCHGRVITSFLANWFHVPYHEIANLKTPGNCDVIEISGDSKNWQARRIYDGENFQPVKNDNPLDRVNTPRITVQTLPRVPSHLRID